MDAPHLLPHHCNTWHLILPIAISATVPPRYDKNKKQHK